MPTREPKLVEIQVDAQLTETIRQLHEVSSRIDERIKHLIEKQTGMADKLEQISQAMSDVKTRIAVLENSDIEQTGEDLDELDKKVAVFERQLNNGIKTDVDDMKVRVRTLELSNEHNTSFRTKGEARIQWWLDVSWKFVQILFAAALTYFLARK
jgi:chromosome segregation ATPase